MIGPHSHRIMNEHAEHFGSNAQFDRSFHPSPGVDRKMPMFKISQQPMTDVDGSVADQ